MHFLLCVVSAGVAPSLRRFRLILVVLLFFLSLIAEPKSPVIIQACFSSLRSPETLPVRQWMESFIGCGNVRTIADKKALCKILLRLDR